MSFTPVDRMCFQIMLGTAQSKGWRGDILKEQLGFAEVIRLFAPEDSVPAHFITRVTDATVVLLDCHQMQMVGHFDSVMAALGAVSRLVAEQGKVWPVPCRDQPDA